MKFFVLSLFIVLVLSQTTCVSPQVPVTLVRTYQGSSEQESVEIYEGNYLTGTLIARENGYGHSSTTTENTYCLNPTMHTLVAIDGAKNGWNDGSKFQLKTRGGIIILTGTLDRYQRAEFKFSPTFTVASTESWKYTTTAQSGNSWTAQTFSDNSWTTYAPGNFPAINSITRYFRYTTNLPASRARFAIADLGVYSSEGFVLYINGNEVLRRNLPAGTITSTTPASSVDAFAAWRRITIPARSDLFKVNGQDSSRVTFAVEVHGTSATPSETVEKFRGVLIFVYGECNYRVVDGSVSASKEADYWGEPPSNVFDGDIQTKWYLNNVINVGPGSVTYTFNNGRREWVNKYSITTGNAIVERRPYEWTIEGSNDDVTWTMLDHRSMPVWIGNRQALEFPMRTNTNSYNKLRFTIIKAGDGGVNNESEVSDVSFFACNYDIETPSLSYGVSSVALVANMDDKYYYPTQNGFKNFNISPPLEVGGPITFDPLTGSLHIVPTAAITATTYTISAIHENNNQMTQTSISVSATVCAYPNIRFDVYQRVGASDTNGDAETVELYNGAARIFAASLTASDPNVGAYVDKTYKFCQPPALYTVKLIAGTTAGFSGVSYVSLDIYTYEDNRKITASRSNLRGAISRSYTFNSALIAPTSTKALLNSATIPAGWNTLSFNDAAWVAPTDNKYTSTSKFLFVRHQFTIPSNSAYLGFELMYTVGASPLIFVDGTEIVRYDVSGGDFTDATTGYVGSNNWRTITGTLTTLPAGNHVIAIAYVGGASDQITDHITRAYLRMLADCDDNARTWDAGSGQSSSAWGYGDAGNLFDSNYNTRGSLAANNEHPLPQYWNGNFNGWRFETFNKFCLVSNWDAPHQDPASFTLLGSTGDWYTWEELYTATDVVFEERSTRYCFYMPNQNKAYNIYRLQVNSLNDPSTDKALLAEIELYLVDYNKITVSPLSYGSHNSINGYVGATLTSIAPTTLYYKNFQISGGALPVGVTFSSSSGTFAGTPTAPSSRTTYTVTAESIHGSSSSTTITIEVLACNLPNVLLTLKFYDMNDAYSSQNGFSLANVNGASIISVPQFPNYMATRFYGFCVPAGPYTLTLTDAYGDGWGSAKVDVIDDQNNVMLTASCLAGESPKAVMINAGYLAKFGSTTWKYTSGANVPADWNSVNFVDSTWSSAKSGQFTGLTGVTSYYRTTVTATALTHYALYEVKMNIRDGLIAYLNGVEIYRINLGSTVTSTTRATAQFPAVTTVMTTDSVQFGNLREGNNVFAFELHTYSDVMENTFDAQITLQASGTNRVTDGSVTTNHPGLDDGYWHETEDKAFDHDKGTKYYASGCGYDTWVQYNYPNNRKEYVSSISISRGNNWNRMPDYYKLYGVEGTTETLISSTFNFTFGAHGTRDGTLTYDFVNKKAYGAYRIYIDSYSCTEGLEIGEIELNAKRIGSYCEAEGNWFAVLDGQYSSIPCGTGLYGVKRRMCSNTKFGAIDESGCVAMPPKNFTYSAKAYVFHAKTYSTTPSPNIIGAYVYYNITPALPSGLSIGRNTGIISGKADNTFAETTFTVMACNLAGMNKVESCITTEVTISAIPAEGLSGGAIALIVIAAIIIVIFVLFVVFIIFNRRKGSKRGGHKVMKTGKAEVKKSAGGDKKVRI